MSNENQNKKAAEKAKEVEEKLKDKKKKKQKILIKQNKISSSTLNLFKSPYNF